MSTLHLVTAPLFAVLLGVPVWLGVREIRKWRDRSTIISFNQLVIRMLNCALLMGLIGMFAWGLWTMEPNGHSTRQHLIYWYNCTALGLLVMAIAVFDFSVIWVFRRRNGQALREQARERHDRLMEDLEREHEKYNAARHTR